ncbi:hypothetical protein ACEPAF_28 [Sanghuangporus sanghuang]
MAKAVYCLRVLRLDDSADRLIRPAYLKESRYFIKASLARESVRTRVKEGMPFCWNEDLYLPISDQRDGEEIRIELKRKQRFKLLSNACVGFCSIDPTKLAQESNSGDVRLDLLSPKSLESVGTVFVRLEHSTQKELASTNIQNAKSALQEDNNDLKTTLKTVADRIGRFHEFATAVAELHPYAKLAYALMSGLYKVVADQFQRDEALIRLLSTVSDAFNFVTDIETLQNKTKNLPKIIEKLLQETIDCARFVKLYLDHGFFRRITMTTAGQRITDFETSFRDLRASLDSNIGLNSALVLDGISNKLDIIAQQQVIQRLAGTVNPASESAWSSDLCLPGTRIDILNDIVEWFLSDSPENLLWLHGVAGSGKSTIAATIANSRFDMSLGAILRFKRGESREGSIIPILAYKLAGFDPTISKHIADAVTANSNITDLAIDEQFKILILQPLAASATSLTSPVIIIMDALDEYGTPGRIRNRILEVLRQHIPELPRNFRFLITSRRERDIDSIFLSYRNTAKSPIRVIELDYNSETSRRDVRFFLGHEIRRILEDSLEDTIENEINILADAAAGLFIWASTVIKLVEEYTFPRRKLRELTSNTRRIAGINNLYASILLGSIKWDDDETKVWTTRILALIVLGKAPLTISTIGTILGLSRQDCHDVLSRLRSIVDYSGEGNPERPVRLFHTSLSDYLLSCTPSEKEPWFIDAISENSFIALRCFAVMKDDLRFNMCGIKSSRVSMGDDYSAGLDMNNETNISSHLEYACLWWARHLCDTNYSFLLHENLSDHIYTRLLFWFEALSILKRFLHIASQVLLDCSRWIEAHDETMSTFLYDARTLAITFALPISESTSQIYLSALPLTKDDNVVSVHYAERLSSDFLACFHREGKKAEALLMQSFERHHHPVLSVEFSPDGRQVGSVAQDDEVYIWDPDSGKVIYGPHRGFTVAFVPDGVRIVSKGMDGRIKVLNPENGEELDLPRHPGNIKTVAFSHDSSQIFSGFDDGFLTIWDVKKRENVMTRKIEHKIASFSTSIDGTLLVLCWCDDAAIVWNARKDEIEFGPFKHHHTEPTSLKMSPDGKRIAVGYYGKGITVWDSVTKQVVCDSESIDEIFVISFSPDGQRIVSGSGWQRLVTSWDAVTGAVVSGPFKGHTNSIQSVAYSPDGTRIVSGSHDGTAKIWNAKTGRVEDGTPNYHSKVVSTLTVSCDGKYFLSSSWDSTVILWDTQSGKAILGPLKSPANAIWAGALSPDGSRIVSGYMTGLALRDAKTGEVLYQRQQPEVPRKGDDINHVYSISFSPTGSQFVTGDYYGTVNVWETDSGRVLAGPSQVHPGGYCPVAFSPNGEQVVSGGGDASVKVWRWDASTGRIDVEQEFELHMRSVLTVAFSPDGRRIASGGHDGLTVVWELNSGEAICVYQHRATVWSVDFFPDGKWVASGSGDKTVVVLDVENDEVICGPFTGHTHPITSIAVFPDSSRIITGSEDGTIRIWNVVRNTHSSPTWTLSNDGWIHDPEEQPLIWIPPDLRQTLWRPQNASVVSCPFTTKLDFTKFPKHDEWMKCISSW